MDALELLSGDAQTFVQKVWASRVHLHHAEPADLVGLLSFDDVDRLLTSTAIRTPAVRLAKDGSVLPSSAYTRSATIAGSPLTGLVDARKVIDLFEDGATVVLQGLHRYWPPLTRLVADLEAALGHPCQANAYLTPPGSQGFAVHSDSHDVFVFQTHGSKRWEVHEDGQVHDVLLEPGLSMYLPTGTPHAARALNTVSLHVTLGINQLTWHALLQSAVTKALADMPDDHLPAGYVEDPTLLVDGIEDRLRALSERLSTASGEEIAADQVRRFLTGRTPKLAGALVDRMALPDLTDETHLRRRPGVACVLVAEGEQLRVLLGDRDLVVPARIAPAVEQVRTATTLRPRDLAEHLDEPGRLVLCRRLVREGLLELGDR